MAKYSAFADLLGPRADVAHFATPSIIVKVGLPSKDFPVNKHILTKHSEYFKAALAEQWQEGKCRVVTMPEDDALSFQVYLSWLYEGRIYLEKEFLQKSDHMWQRVFAAYALGDKLLDAAFKDALTDATVALLLRVMDHGLARAPFGTSLQELYEKTVAGAPMRRLVVHRWARVANRDDVITDDFPGAFLVDLCKALSDKAKVTPEESTENAALRCAFHEHAPGKENCYRTKRS